MLNFLKQFPSARTIKSATDEAISKALFNSSSGRKPSITPYEIINAANSSVATTGIAKELILKGKISTLLHLMDRLDEITEMLSSYCQSIMLEDLRIITSIDGIDTPTGSAFLAEVGDIYRFSSYKKLTAFAGIDPTVYQSGRFQGTGKISKRTNIHLRRLIYIMTVKGIRINTVFRTFFLKRKQDDLPFRKAVMATAHKLIRTIFSMLYHKSFFRVKDNSL